MSVARSRHQNTIRRVRGIAIAIAMHVVHSSFLIPYFSPSDPRFVSRLLGRKLGLADPGPAQLDVQHPLHGAQDLLVGLGGASFEVLDHPDGGVTLGGQILLGHFRLHLVAAADDGLGHVVPHGFGLDDFVRPVDLGQVLTFGRGFLGEGMLGGEIVWEGWKGETYRIGGSEFLLGGDDVAGALGGVEGGTTFDHVFTLVAAGGAGAGLAADAGHVVPVVVCHG